MGRCEDCPCCGYGPAGESWPRGFMNAPYIFHDSAGETLGVFVNWEEAEKFIEAMQKEKVNENTNRK